MAVKIGFGGLVIALIVVTVLALSYRKKWKAADAKLVANESTDSE